MVVVVMISTVRVLKPLEISMFKNHLLLSVAVADKYSKLLTFR